jgi:hypothetical protein
MVTAALAVLVVIVKMAAVVIALIIALYTSPQTRPFAILLGPAVYQMPEPEEKIAER